MKRGTHRANTRDTRNTAVLRLRSGKLSTEIEKDAPKKGLELLTTLGRPQKIALQQQQQQ